MVRPITLLPQPITPISRLSVQVGDGQHENVAILNRVDQSIGKAIKAATAQTFL